MSATGNIQISQELFDDIVSLLILLDDQSGVPEDVDNLCDRIRFHIVEKIIRMRRRSAFTAYKTSVGNDEKKAALKEYLKLGDCTAVLGAKEKSCTKP